MAALQGLAGTAPHFAPHFGAQHSPLTPRTGTAGSRPLVAAGLAATAPGAASHALGKAESNFHFRVRKCFFRIIWVLLRDFKRYVFFLGDGATLLLPPRTHPRLAILVCYQPLAPFPLMSYSYRPIANAPLLPLSSRLPHFERQIFARSLHSSFTRD